MMTSAEQRFWAGVVFEPMSGCWLWGQYLRPNGYGYIRDKGKTTGVHRFSYELHKGEIANGLVIDHLCRNRACVNPDHLRACTHKENLLADNSEALAKNNSLKMACPKCDGPYTFAKNGERRCRSCATKLMREWRKVNQRSDRPMRTPGGQP